jgi:DNA-binding winged helix-turn-helix (wHTH) protein
VITRFGSFALDPDVRLLTRDGVSLHLTPKAFALLMLLLEARPRAVAKETLVARLWPATFVADANLSNLIAEIRAALGDDPRRPTWIRTAHRFGYAFCGPAMPDPAQPAAPSRCWLEWGPRHFPLATGAHLVGRDPDAEIKLDPPTVSRRHARVVVGADGVSLEDCGSKNGTWRGNVKVTGPVRLADGDAIRFGSVCMIFRRRTHAATTITREDATSGPA